MAFDPVQRTPESSGLPGASVVAPVRASTFRSELADFWRFLRHPRLRVRRLARRAGAGALADFHPHIRVGRLFAWVAVLWVVNLFVLGPLAGAAAGAGGSVHRLDVHHIPWMTAVLWAPLVEELVFRFGLRRPLIALWFIPLAAVAMVAGPRWWTGVLLAVALALAVGLTLRMRPTRFRWRRWYSRHFGWFFYLSAFAFAALHLRNFNLGAGSYALLPLLVLPQWITGLVLSWMRVRRGVGASIALHALFNAGPLLLIAALLRWLPQLAT